VTRPIVKILVGYDSSAFYVHKLLLCGKSEYFEKCLRGNFAEAATGEILLADTDTNTFKTFVRLLYAGGIAPVPLEHPKSLERDLGPTESSSR
jgi:hypothetical protein